jgi:TolB-like protein/DNA-binding LytR/AlgR family response regulator
MPLQNKIHAEELIPEQSIAVLPFRNMSSEKENEYFSDGITEEIINALTKVEGLNVIARTSSFAFKGMDIDLREIGARLNVAYILEGSVRKAGNKVRVAAQLIKAQDGFHIFSEVYDRELQDIFEVQDEISNKIAQKFTDNFGIQKDEKKLSSASTDNMEAYELYLKGRFNLSKGSREAAKEAMHYFEAAAKKDNKFASPVSGLAACYTFLGGSGFMNTSQAFNKAREHAQKAILIDEDDAQSHLALASSAFWCDWDFESCGNSIRKAIRLSPGTSAIHGFNSLFLMASGRLDEAFVEARLATKLDPLSPKGKFHLGELLYRSKKYLDAIEVFDDILTEQPFYNQTSIFKAWCLLFLGETKSAIEIFSQIPVANNEFITFFGGLASAYSKQNKIDKVLDCLKDFKSQVEKGNLHWLNYQYSLIFRALGETEKMFEQLEKCLSEKNSPCIFIHVDPVWDEFRNDPRFKKIIAKAFSPGKKDKSIRIKSDTKEDLQLDLNKLLCIEAQENYTRIVWIENEKVLEKLLRITLKKLEDQINDTAIVRCHRSYIINTEAEFTILGNSNGYHLKSKFLNYTIPISRSLGKEIINQLRISR